TAFGNWYEWNGSGWTPSAIPSSPDGTALPAGGAGTLTTSNGVWSFGAAAAGGFSILLNGQSAAGGSAASLEVAQNGNLFADNAFGNCTSGMVRGGALRLTQRLRRLRTSLSTPRIYTCEISLLPQAERALLRRT